jgi:hypothetical protein
MNCLTLLLTGLSSNSLNLQLSLVKVLDVLIRFIAASSANAVAYGRSVFFDNPRTKIPLPGGTEAWSGFTQVRFGLSSLWSWFCYLYS